MSDGELAFWAIIFVVCGLSICWTMWEWRKEVNRAKEKGERRTLDG